MATGTDLRALGGRVIKRKLLSDSAGFRALYKLSMAKGAFGCPKLTTKSFAKVGASQSEHFGSSRGVQGSQNKRSPKEACSLALQALQMLQEASAQDWDSKPRQSRKLAALNLTAGGAR